MSNGFRVMAGCAVVLAIGIAAGAQETAVKGSLSALVVDSSGALVPAAKVTISGPTGTKALSTDQTGTAAFPLLVPGFYSVKVEKSGFKATELKSVEVVTDRTASVRMTLQPGAVNEVVEVTASALAVDTTSSAVGANLNDTFYSRIPVQRNVADLFYLSPGVASGGGSGQSNPSISGGSGLENLYVADGVNITDSSFGGLGVFSRNYGSLGTGINLSFIEEVQVKTGGYEPQYGKATGGIIQIVTKSGGTSYHGSLGAYFAPKQFEATRLHPDDFGLVNPFGKTLHLGSYEASGELGGYVPGLRNRLFFFGSYNPNYGKTFVLPPPSSGIFSHGQYDLNTLTNSYAVKATFKLSDSHQLESSLFGDPAHNNIGPRRTLVTENSTSFSRWNYGTRDWVARYNGSMSPTWLVNASVTYNFNKFDESGFGNFNQIFDLTQTAPGQRGEFIPIGLGFLENTKSHSYGTTLDTSKVVHALGEHTFSVGYHLERPYYDALREESGPQYVLPATNAAGQTILPPNAAGATTDAAFLLELAPSSCTLCPLMNIAGSPQPVFLNLTRGNFGNKTVKTNATYQAGYANDSWSISRRVTVSAGLRWEQHELRGTTIHYTFTDAWSPRLGFVIDPTGNRRTKIYGNFGRYNYVLPLDVAIRSLSNEDDIIGAYLAPDFDPSTNMVKLNSFGTVTPIFDPAHVLNSVGTVDASGNCVSPPCGVGGGIAVSNQSTEGFAPGTKMEYEDEYVIGAEHEFKTGLVVGAKYLRRELRRIIEDTGGISPEAALAGIPQVFQIANVDGQSDLFTNPVAHTYPVGTPTANKPAQCNLGSSTNPGFDNSQVTDTFGNVLGAVCFEPLGANGQFPGSAIPDGIPDGFTNPKRIYWAVEMEANRAFASHWQVRANWRIAKLFGNYEGAFRNDNGQTDPGISSLFDFTPGLFGLLGDQFRPGVLNTDRRHIANLQFSYELPGGFLRDLTIGAGVNLQSGIPINDLKAHPVYQNAGEVPVGGRGALGRTRPMSGIDTRLDYPVRIGEKARLHFAADLFNIFNSRTLLRVDQDEDLFFGTANSDFKKPGDPNNVGSSSSSFQRPFNARLSVRFEF